MSVITGVLFHAGGASCASVCYTPQRETRGWSWQTYWLAQAVVCWLVLPVLGAWITIPHLMEVLAEAPKSAMYKSFILGAAYGIGGTAFGLAIRYIGFSLTYAISVGISCVVGTLLPPLVHGELLSILDKTGSGWVMSGVAMGALGISVCGLAGWSKEKELEKNEKIKSSFSFAKGLPLCLLAGVLSAVYGFSLDQGQPIADVAQKYGAGLFRINVIYIFSNTGAFLSTAVYCIYLHIKKQTFSEYKKSTDDKRSSALSINYVMAFITGVLWYSQFFFYGLGHTRLGEYKFSSWAIHMIMLVLFSSIVGLVLKEWKEVKGRTKWTLAVAVIILIFAVLVLTYGNYLGSAGAAA
ncbi:MAG: L-rhamnose/proton symporter RhaT [Bacteroidota bacterium]|nr:L-rhamnose/proton symporter RhaT [Bacteroidota bacterium]